MPSTPTSIALADGEPTPVTHTFTTIQNPEGGLVAATDAQLELREMLHFYPETLKSGAEKRTYVIKVPVVETINGVPTRTGEDTITVNLVSSPRSSTQRRKNLRVMASNLLSKAEVVATMDGNQRFF